MNIKAQQSISSRTGEENKYTLAERKMQEHIDAVLRSPSNKRIVVAGPGTGKTYLFNKILEGKKNTLTLTFVNALVEDLSLELCGLSLVKTLHGYARSALRKATRRDIKIFPKLPIVIKEDAQILLKQTIDFEYLFHNRFDEQKHIEFYKKRKDYYGHYGFSDIVFAAISYFEKNTERIPTFSQVVVDEFQDFNKLEVSLIDLLAENSPVLLVGDDDQALYESLKSASSKHIRERYSYNNSDYASFTLPYCLRCTRVIVEATNDIIAGATRTGHLTSRISKPFCYFDDEEKDRVSDENPKLIYNQSYANQIPWFIHKCIGQIAEEVRVKFTVLIISPTKRQCRFILNALKDKGFETVRFVERTDNEEPTLLDGLKLLLQDKKSNLGWRIVAKKLLESTDFENLLRSTDNADPKGISDLIEPSHQKEVAQMLKALRAVRDGKVKHDETELRDILKKVDIDAYGMARDYLKDQINSGEPTISNPGIRKTPVTITTIQGSKGLSADYVFITHLDDQYFIRDMDKTKISDQDICNFVVALTRARRKVFLISSDTTRMPIFLKWIDKKRIREMKTKDKSAP
jgi:superfamily I DNA/RNA helicase